MESINQAYLLGLSNAASMYGVKLAFFESLKADALGLGKDIATQAVGSPRKAYEQYQAGTLFHPEEGMLHHSKVLWPSMPAPSPIPGPLPTPGPGEAPHTPFAQFKNRASQVGTHVKNRAAQAGVWAGRLQNVGLPAYHAYKALQGEGDPNEGRLTNALSAVGQGLGNAYGLPIAGMLGAPYIGRAGAFVGKQLGRFLGSKPRYPSQAMPQYEEQQQEPPMPQQRQPQYNPRYNYAQ